MLTDETFANFFCRVVPSVTATGKRRAPTGGFSDQIWPEASELQLRIDYSHGPWRNEDGLRSDA